MEKKTSLKVKLVLFWKDHMLMYRKSVKKENNHALMAFDLFCNY